MKTLTLEILTDLVEDMLVESNPYHDASGKFTSKGAAVAYQSGAMAAGRAAGIQAKMAGKDRETVRQAILQALQGAVGQREAGQQLLIKAQQARRLKNAFNQAYREAKAKGLIRSIKPRQAPPMSASRQLTWKADRRANYRRWH